MSRPIVEGLNLIIIVTISLCFTCISCELQQKTNPDLSVDNNELFLSEKKAERFRIQRKLKGHIKGPINHFLKPTELAIKNSHLLVFDKDKNPIIQFLELPDFKFIKAFGKKGKGPGEFERPRTNNQFTNNSLWIKDRHFTRLMNIDSMLISEEYQTNEVHVHPPEIHLIYSLFHISDTLVIGFSADGKGRYFLLNPQTDDINFVSFFPKIDQPESHRGILGQLYYSRNAIRPDRKKLVSAMAFFPRIDFINPDGSLDFSTVFPIKKELATDNEGISIVNSFEYYTDVYATQDYIYLLYKGLDPEKVERGDESNGYGSEDIHVLDWEGNAIVDISLDHKILDLVVDEARKKIYGILDLSILDESIEQAIIEFDLPSLTN